MNAFLKIAAALLCLTTAGAADIVTPAPQPQKNQAPVLPEGEIRIRNGIIILGKICQYMSEVNCHDTAEAAVPRLMALLEEMQAWSQSFASLPPLSEPERVAYEERYLPTISRINSMLESQAARIAAAEYYGSRNLPAVLVRFVQLGNP